jgi:signal transduction histidine kinase
VTLRRLKWLAILAPLLFLGSLEALRRWVAPDLFTAWPGYLLLSGAVLLGTLLFAQAIFDVVGQLQERLAYQNRELLALHGAELAIVGELELDAVLQRVVDQARELVGARYGALSYLRDDGGIGAFLTSGITAEQRAELGPIPVGHGLLGVVLREGEHLRLDDLTRDSRSVGFPPHHPPMRSLLAVPIQSSNRILGNLYLTEKGSAPAFSRADEETLTRFATLAALAIENARLHHQVRALAVTEERGRIAREMHDSLAQMLGYVNTKAQAAQTFMQNGQHDRAAGQLGQLSEAAREANADVRENILGLRTSLNSERGFVETLRDYVMLWQEQSGQGGITVQLDLPATDSRLPLAPLPEVQLLRIIQEALTNVRKHAGATQVRIEVRELDDEIVTTIEDDGVGFDIASLGRTGFPRFGLATMRERAEAAGGTFDIMSTPRHGTRLEIRLPTEHMASRDGNQAGEQSHADTHR